MRSASLTLKADQQVLWELISERRYALDAYHKPQKRAAMLPV
jgi:hypothetical protein